MLLFSVFYVLGVTIVYSVNPLVNGYLLALSLLLLPGVLYILCSHFPCESLRYISRIGLLGQTVNRYAILLVIVFYLFLAVLDLSSCSGFSLVWVSRLLIVLASLVVELGL